MKVVYRVIEVRHHLIGGLKLQLPSLSMTTRRQHAARAQPPSASENNIMYMATPPPTFSSGGSRSIRQKTHALRPVQPQKPTSSTNQSGDLESPSVNLEETLAYDELLRLKRSRTEDEAKLLTMLTASSSSSVLHNELKAAGFREEWRVKREQQVLVRLRERHTQEQAMLAHEREQRIQTLRAHFRYVAPAL
jgi:hypothetical protein